MRISIVQQIAAEDDQIRQEQQSYVVGYVSVLADAFVRVCDSSIMSW